MEDLIVEANKRIVALTVIDEESTATCKIDWEDWYDHVRYVEVLRKKYGPDDIKGRRLLIRDLLESGD